jgi:O-antigen/teichoic acid export membrane protein
MEEEFAPQPVASWFMLAAVASLLITAAFCILYMMHVLADPAAMPVDQRLAYEATPAWVIGAFGVGAWAGLAGGLLLVMRRRQAEPAMLVALVGMLVWLAGSLAVAPLRDAMSANDLVVIIVMLGATWTIFWFARHSRMRSWLK